MFSHPIDKEIVYCRESEEEIDINQIEPDHVHFALFESEAGQCRDRYFYTCPHCFRPFSLDYIYIN